MNLNELVKRALNSFTKSKEADRSSTAIVGASPESGIEERIKSIYGEDKFELQKLYEKWAVMDSWLIRDEALPLLQGIEPGSPALKSDPELMQQINELWSHAKNCIEQGVLEIEEKSGEASSWRIHPVDAYRWATIGRIPLPVELTNLMDYLSNVVRTQERQSFDSISDEDRFNSDGFDIARQRVLGMSLAILAAYPDQCRNRQGQVNINKIIGIINEKGSFWLGDEDIGLSNTAMRDLLSKWLGTLPLQNQ